MQSVNGAIPVSRQRSVQAVAPIVLSISLVSCGLLLIFSAVPNSYTKMVSWPYCLWWQGSFLGICSVSLWLCRRFEIPVYGLGHVLDKCFIGLLLCAGISAAFSEFRAVSVQSVLLLVGYGIVLYLLVNGLILYKQGQRWLWSGVVWAGSLTNGVGLALWRPKLAMWTSDGFYDAIRNPMPLGHHNFVGGYALLLLPIVIGYTFTLRSKSRWLGIGAIALNVVSLYASGSRGALLGGILAGGLALIFFLYQHRPKSAWQTALLASGCILLIGLASTNPRFRALAAVPLAADRASFSIEQIADSPVKDRLFMLQSGHSILRAHPLLGIGPGTLSRSYSAYRPFTAGAGLDLVQQLHSTPAQLLAELGLLGAGVIGATSVVLIRLWRNLSHQSLTSVDRILLHSIGFSGLAYGLSSLTDYQLENVGIAMTLASLLGLLIGLSHRYFPAKSSLSIPRGWRRLISLGLLLYICSLAQAWIPLDIGFYLASQAQQATRAGSVADGHTLLSTAADLNKWDPTFAALSAEQLTHLSQSMAQPETQALLKDEAIAAWKSALNAAPNDPWFNQNLALLLGDSQAAQAVQYLRHTTRLIPRSHYYTYCALGQLYLSQGKRQKAEQAFVLEAIANPIFLLQPIWQQSDMSALQSSVVHSTLTHWTDIVSKTSPSTIQYHWLSSQIALIGWWFHSEPRVAFPSINSEGQSIGSTVVESLVHSEIDEVRSHELLSEAISNSSAATHSSALALLRAWMFPEQYLNDLLARVSASDHEQRTIAQNIQAHRDLRTWLTSVQQPASPARRYGLSFAYRNSAANDLSLISLPISAASYPLINELGLLQRPPREFFQLDTAMNSLASRLYS